MFCPNCGFEIADSSKFCCECGAPIQKKEAIVFTTREDEIKKIIEQLKKKVWYTLVDLKPEGPFTDEELTQLLEDGSITSSTEIWHIESDEVIPYAQKETYGQTEEAIFMEMESVREDVGIEEASEEIFDQDSESEHEAFPEDIVSEDVEEEIENAPSEEEVVEKSFEQQDELFDEEISADIEIVEDPLEQEEEWIEDEADDINENIESKEEKLVEQTDSMEEDLEDAEPEKQEEVEEEPKWYYVDALHNRQGPITETDFNSLIDEGIIHAMTYIWTPGMQSWVFLKDSSYDAQKNHSVEEKISQNEPEVFAVDRYWEEEPQDDQKVEPEVSSSNPVKTNWYYVDRMNMRQGPVSTDQIKSLVKEGVIHERTYIWTSGMAGWELMKDTEFYHPEPEQSKDWYYIDDARVRQGKYSDSEMEAFLSQGIITENTYVWKAGMPQWALLLSTSLSKKEQVTSSQSDDEPWFYRGIDNSRVGPFTAKELEELLNRGTLSYETDVWQRGMSNWKPLSATSLAKQPKQEEVQWYVQLGGQTMGPYPQSTVITMLRNKEINSRTYVWCADMNDWEQIRDTSLVK